MPIVVLAKTLRRKKQKRKKVVAKRSATRRMTAVVQKTRRQKRTRRPKRTGAEIENGRGRDRSLDHDRVGKRKIETEKDPLATKGTVAEKVVRKEAEKKTDQAARWQAIERQWVPREMASLPVVMASGVL